MVKNIFCGLIVSGCFAVSSMDNSCNRSGTFFYKVPSQLYDSHHSREMDPRYDNDSTWLELRSKKDNECEELIAKEDLSEKELDALESEQDCNKKAKAFEEAFFGNEFLYRKFQALVAASSENIGDLASMHSEFFRWIISNQRGNYEKAKSLVGLYKSLNNYPRYLLWKCIAVFLNLPVERM